MSNNIKKSAFKFVRKGLKGQVNLKSTVDYLHKLGYVVEFFNNTKGQDIIKTYSLTDVAMIKKAFTIKSDDLQIIFINDSYGKQETLHLIIHETAHIVLGQLDRTGIERDRMREESEADMFTYIVLYDKPSKLPLHVCIIGSAVILFFITLYPNKPTVFPNQTDAVSALADNLVTAPKSEAESMPDSDAVYITPYGKKYHKKDCYTTKGSSLTAISEIDAKKNYKPCKICNP